MKTINFVTGNQNKLKEFTQIIGTIETYEFQAKNIDLPEYQGEPVDVAISKCKTGKFLMFILSHFF